MAAQGTRVRFQITATDLSINEGSVFSNADCGTPRDPPILPTGRAGDVSINLSGILKLTNTATVNTDTFGFGNGGDIFIRAADVELSNAGINSDTYGFGNAGSIDIHTGDITMTEAAYVSTASTVFYSNVGPFYGVGNSGAVVISATGNISVGSYSSVTTETDFFGSGGNIVLYAGNLISVDDGSLVEADALGDGAAGTISITAASLSISGGKAGLAKVASDAFGQYGLGGAGGVNVEVSGGVSISAGGEITASAGGYAQSAGDVSVNAKNIYIEAGSAQQEATGIFAEDGSVYNFFVEPSSGSVDVIVGGELRMNGGEISSAGFNAAAGGDVTVKASKIFAYDNAYIISKYDTPDGAGNAGTVTVSSPYIILSDFTTIDSGAYGNAGGDAGSVTVNTRSLTLQSGASIKTNSTNGPAGDINLVLGSGGHLLLQGTTDPGAITTTSGTKSGGKISVDGGSAIVLNGGLIQALGPGDAADVGLQSPIIESADRVNQIAVAGVLQLGSQIVDVAEAVTNVDLAFLDASQVLKGQCAARQANGEASGTGPRPPRNLYASPPPTHDEAPKKRAAPSAAAAHDRAGLQRIAGARGRGAWGRTEHRPQAFWLPRWR